MSRYLLAFLDRSNIGNAKVASLQKDLKITDVQYRIDAYTQINTSRINMKAY
jgi:hypothetical protein